MILHTDKLNYTTPWTGVRLFTGNATLRNDGALVMGRGAARQVRDHYPTAPYALGARIRRKLRSRAIRFYGLVCYALTPGQTLGAFQVKYHWGDAADLNLIAASTQLLHDTLLSRTIRVDMNFPGIGNGRLRYEDVAPLLLALPNNVHIWR